MAALLEWRPGTGDYTALAFDGFRLAWYRSGLVTDAIIRCGAKRVVVTDAALTDIIAESAPVTDAPSTLSQPDKILWASRRQATP